MSEMLCVEAESAVTEDDKKALISDDDLRQQRQFILRKAAEFDGTPFTFQRLLFFVHLHAFDFITSSYIYIIKLQ